MYMYANTRSFIDNIPTATKIFDPKMLAMLSEYPHTKEYLTGIKALKDQPLTLKIPQVLDIITALHESNATTLNAQGKAVSADQYIRYMLEFAVNLGIPESDIGTFILTVINKTKADTAAVFKLIFSDDPAKKAQIKQALAAYNITGPSFLLHLIDSCTAKGINTSTLLSESATGDKDASVWKYLIDCQAQGISYDKAIQLLDTIIKNTVAGKTSSVLAKTITLLETTTVNIDILITNITKVVRTPEQTLMSMVDAYTDNKDLQSFLNSAVSTLFHNDLQGKRDTPQAQEIKQFLETLMTYGDKADRGKIISALYSLTQTGSVTSAAEALTIIQNIVTKKTFSIDLTGHATDTLSYMLKQLHTVEKQLSASTLVTLRALSPLDETSMQSVITNYYLAISATDLMTLEVPENKARDLLALVSGHCGRSALLGKVLQEYLQKRYPETTRTELWPMLTTELWQTDVSTIKKIFASPTVQDLSEKIQALVIKYMHEDKIIELQLLAHALSITPRIQATILTPELRPTLKQVQADIQSIFMPQTTETKKISGTAVSPEINTVALRLEAIIQKTLTQEITIPPISHQELVTQHNMQTATMKATKESVIQQDIAMATIVSESLTSISANTSPTTMDQINREALLQEARAIINKLEEIKTVENTPAVEKIEALILIVAQMHITSLFRQLLQSINGALTTNNPELNMIIPMLAQSASTEHIPSSIITATSVTLNVRVLPIIADVLQRLPQSEQPFVIQTMPQTIVNAYIASLMANIPAGTTAAVVSLAGTLQAIHSWADLVIAISQIHTTIHAQQQLKEFIETMVQAHSEFTQAITHTVEKQLTAMHQEYRTQESTATEKTNKTPIRQSKLKELLKNTITLNPLTNLSDTVLEELTTIIEKLYQGKLIDISTLTPALVAIMMILPAFIKELFLREIRKDTTHHADWLAQYINEANGTETLTEQAIQATTHAEAA